MSIWVDGGSSDPSIFCLHGGYCYFVADVKFPRCKQVQTRDEGCRAGDACGVSYAWEKVIK